ncbi:MAG: hypothetical protein PHY45_17030 [Rhodocyclaceae bacterium]|nr:hypothetical protein [Rhodocyclaceae bacterium]
MDGSNSATRFAPFAESHDHASRLLRRHSDARLAPPAAASEILLLLDARGRIQYCGNRDSFLRNDAEMTGKPIAALIPDLPLHEGTPGYNVAYVRFAFANERWRRHLAAAADGVLWPVDVFLRTVSIERSYSLVGLLRLPTDAAVPAAARAETATADVANGAWRIEALAAQPLR